MAVDQHYTVSAEYSDWSWSVGNGNLRMHLQRAASEPYWLGEFVDGRGLASVYRQGDLTRIDFVFDGRCYSRSWRKYFGDRTIARLARAFVTEVIGGAS